MKDANKDNSLILDLDTGENPTEAEIEKADRIRKEMEKKENKRIINLAINSQNSQATCSGDELKFILKDISDKCTDINDHLGDIKSELVGIKELIVVSPTKS